MGVDMQEGQKIFAPCGGNDLVAKLAMRLHLPELLGSQLAGLQQDRIGDTDLSDIMQHRGQQQVIAPLTALADFLSQDLGITTDTDGMLAGLVIAPFPSSGQAVNDLNLSPSEFRRPLPNLLLKYLGLIREILLMSTQHECIADSRQ